MTARARTLWACDTSVAIAALDPNHEDHAVCRRSVKDHKPALAGHAAFETYSVLTRLPPPLRLSAAQAAKVLSAAFPGECSLDSSQHNPLRALLAEAGIVGGSVYDGLVGQACVVNGRKLLTRDRRAERTYRALGVSYETVGR